MSEIIELKNVGKIYNQGKPNELEVLTDINLKIERGEMVAIFGPSCSG
jgi:ABC-type lipoprotein export system ATPase subunit